MWRKIYNWLIGDYQKKPKKQSKITVNGITIPFVNDIGDLLFIVDNDGELIKFKLNKKNVVEWQD
jgi:hypothetical protein